MDSMDYFERAEKSNKLYRKVVVMLLCVGIVVLVIAGFLVYRLNAANHSTSQDALNVITQNEVKLNENLTNSLHCVLLLLPPQTFSTPTVNACFKQPSNITPPKR